MKAIKAIYQNGKVKLSENPPPQGRWRLSLFFRNPATIRGRRFSTTRARGRRLPAGFGRSETRLQKGKPSPSTLTSYELRNCCGLLATLPATAKSRPRTCATRVSAFSNQSRSSESALSSPCLLSGTVVRSRDTGLPGGRPCRRE